MRGSGNWKRWISAARSAGARAGYRPRSTWSPRKASPIVPLTQIRSPGLAPLRRISAPTATSPIAVSDSTAGPEVATESPPRRSTPKRRLILGEARGELRHPIVAESCRQGRRQEVMERARAHRGEIGQVDAQQLAGDQVGRILGQIMHALDDRIDGDDEPMPGRRNQ